MLTDLARSTMVRMFVALALLAVPFVIMSLTDQMGDRRGLWTALSGALVGIFVERPFKPYNVTSKRWVGRRQWIEIAIVVGIALGVLISFADSLGQGVPIWTVLEQIWIPLYRAALFTTGLTLLRRVLWEREKSARARSKAKSDAMAAVQITPALPRTERRDGQRQ